MLGLARIVASFDVDELLDLTHDVGQRHLLGRAPPVVSCFAHRGLRRPTAWRQCWVAVMWAADAD
jgi:hypothetical protein